MRSFKALLRRILVIDDHNLKGNVLITKTDKNGMIDKRVGHNELSPANKTRAVYLAAKYFNGFHKDPLGKTVICGSDGWFRDGTNYKDAPQGKQRCFALLNNAEKSDRFINIYREDGSLDAGDKLVGWFNTTEEPGGGPYLGEYNPKILKQSIVNKLKNVEVVGFFDTNKAIGEFDSTAIMSGFGLESDLIPYYGGFSLWKCLSRSNSQTKIIPPGINVLTNDYEMIVINTHDTIPSYKINLSTKKFEDLAYTETELFNGLTGEVYCFKKIDSGRLAVVIDEKLYILGYAEDGTVSRLAGAISPADSNSNRYGLYIDPNDAGYLYFTGNEGYVKVNLSDYTTESVAFANQTLLGGLPYKWDNNYTFILANGNGETFVHNQQTGEVIVTSDPTDVCGNMIGTFVYPGMGFSLFDSASDKNIMYVAKVANVRDESIINQYGQYDVADPTSYTSLEDLNTNQLAWLSFGEYSNWYNFFMLSAPMTKTSSDTVEYDWNIKHA